MPFTNLSNCRLQEHNITASNYIRLQYFSSAIHQPQQLSTTSQLQEHIITIYHLQITSDYNILACHSPTSATVDYKLTTRTRYHNITASNYIQLQYFSLPFTNLSNCQLQVDYKNTLSQYNSFKLHPTTIFQLAIQQPQQLSTTSQLQEHIITIYQLHITSDYNILACHSPTSATVNYKSTTRTHYHNISASNYI